MIRLLGALCSACACMLFGLLRYTKMKESWEQLQSYLPSLKKLDTGLQFSSRPLPDMLKNCAPDDQHYLHRLGETMEQAGTLSVQEIFDKAGSPPLLSPGMQQTLLQWLESLMLPDPQYRQKAMDHTIALWEEETEKAREKLMQRGSLAIRLSLLGGCALFILLC